MANYDRFRVQTEFTVQNVALYRTDASYLVGTLERGTSHRKARARMKGKLR
jgi:hypothetical protein